jgi:hypothetical protein
MGNKITVITNPGNRISINTPQKQQIKTVNVVGATSVGTGGITTLSQLTDVNATDASNNETLVYDEASGKYIVKELPIINGGTF